MKVTIIDHIERGAYNRYHEIGSVIYLDQDRAERDKNPKPHKRRSPDFSGVVMSIFDGSAREALNKELKPVGR